MGNNRRAFIIYIHGISPTEGLAARPEWGRSGPADSVDAKHAHTADYRAFRNGVAGRIIDSARREAWDDATHCFVEWGWQHTETDASNLGKLHRLGDAQHHLGSRVVERLRGRGALVPLGVRKLFLFGLSDLFYYMSSDGTRVVRNNLIEQAALAIGEDLEDDALEIELTVIGHSAGSVIALDWVQALFGTNSPLAVGAADPPEAASADDAAAAAPDLPEAGPPPALELPLPDSPVPDAAPVDLGLGVPGPLDNLIKEPPGMRKIDAVRADTASTARRRTQFEDLVREDRMTLNMLVTMGSPIAMLAFRSDEAITYFAYDGRADLRELGLAGPGGGQPEARPAWANIWNKNDPIAFPIEPLVDESPTVRDWHVRPSWNPGKSHTAYWSSKRVHRLFAEWWSAPDSKPPW